MEFLDSQIVILKRTIKMLQRNIVLDEDAEKAVRKIVKEKFIDALNEVVYLMMEYEYNKSTQ